MQSKSLKISERIFEVRTHFNLTKEALGALADVSGTSIANIESGLTKNPGTDLLSAIASKLGVDGHWLLTGEGEMLKSVRNDFFYLPHHTSATQGTHIDHKFPGTMIEVMVRFKGPDGSEVIAWVDPKELPAQEQ